jgi:hypothetical protein
MTEQIKKLLPYISAILLFLVIAAAYFPEAIQGKKLNQHDKQTWKGGAQEILEYQEETGERSFWTNSMFSGMPSYLVSTHAPNNVSKYGFKIIDLGHNLRPMSFVFMLLVGFWITLLFFRVNPWLSIVGALALAFSSYYFIIIEAGHITKVIAIAFMGPVIAGVHYAYKHDALAGTLVMMPFLAMQLLVNHLQITYYTLLIIIVYFIFVLVDTIKKKQYQSFIRTSVVLFIGALLAVSTNLYQILTTYDYGQDSIRGQSELSFDAENKTSGLDKDYATAWSYGKLETLNLFIPNLMGGASGQALSEDSEMYKELQRVQAQNPRQLIKNMPTYWGPQPFTSGPVYVGALVVFLFVMGIFLVKGRLKWWLVSVTALSILLAWGENFNVLTNLFLEYFPGYNKFRTVSMILVIAEFSIPVLGILALRNILKNKVSKAEVMHALKWSGGILGGLIVILLINPGILSFENPGDSRILPEQLIPALEADRASIFRSDAMRSLAFVAIGVILTWLFVKEKLKKEYFLALLGLAILVDLWAVDKRYLNSEDFVSARIEKEPFKKSPADEFILNDNELYFRVMNLTVSTFNDASTSYFHKSIGGYHGAKMRRYQDLIDFHISEESNRLISVLNEETGMRQLDSVLNSLAVLNMLNTKYFILNPEGRPLENMSRLANAWFVEDVKFVKNADEEISALVNPEKVETVVQLFDQKNDLERQIKRLEGRIRSVQGTSQEQTLMQDYGRLTGELDAVKREIDRLRDFNPEKTAVVNERFKTLVPDIQPDSTAQISLSAYKPNELKYKVSVSSPQLAVFSEIYYEKGWNAYLDGEFMPHFRANYVLRAMQILPGEHELVFKFEPEIAKTGTSGSLYGSILFLLAFFGGLAYIIKNKIKEEKTEDKPERT